jgi:LPS export ABC transporter permease LptF/LPS export ABC transporter permease LptG
MRIIDRYICREVVSHAALGLAVFTFVLFIPQLVRLLELAVRHTADAPVVARLLLCTLPGVFTFTLPMAVLVGVLIGLGRLSADSEIIALHALGIGQRRLLLPVGVLSLLGAVVTAAMTFWLGPQALEAFRAIEQRLRTTQASFEIQPRVFDERFPRVVLYVQDVDATSTRWRGIFLAETGTESGTRLTLAEEAIVIADREQGKLQLHLRNGSTHEFSLKEPERYSVSTFGESDVAVDVSSAGAESKAQRTLAELSVPELYRAAQGTGARQRNAAVELHRRFAFPFACLAFSLLAVPLGARPRRGGRAGSFLLTLFLITGYYLMFVGGAGLARQGAIAPWLGVWGANLAASLLGIVLLPRMEGPGEGVLARWAEALAALRKQPARSAAADAGPQPGQESKRAAEPEKQSDAVQAARGNSGKSSSALSGFPMRAAGGGLPLLMDLYLLRYFFNILVMVLAGFVVLFHSFTFFELLNDIARNHIPFLVVWEYFWNLTPLLAYQLLPLAALVAGIVTFTLLAKSNELTAFKSSGVSAYRLTAPVLVAAAGLAGAMVLLDDIYLPESSQRQDALRNQIKGRPAKTFFQARRQWIFGSESKLCNYDFFDPDAGLFAGLTVLELDPATFQMHRRTYAARASWDAARKEWRLERGWRREFRGPTVTNFEKFDQLAAAPLKEPPGYFNREVRQYYQMNRSELGEYIRELQQAGFDVARLSVQWHRKFSYPLMTPIILLLGIPFAARLGARGATTGAALALGLGMAYFAINQLCEAMGAVGQLPPALAAWAPNAVFLLLGASSFFKIPT